MKYTKIEKSKTNVVILEQKKKADRFQYKFSFKKTNYLHL